MNPVPAQPDRWPGLDDDVTGALLDHARWLFQDQQQIDDGVERRATTLLTFDGVAVVLLPTLFESVGSIADSRDWASLILRTALSASAAMLLCSAVFLLRAFKPRSRRAVPLEDAFAVFDAYDRQRHGDSQADEEAVTLERSQFRLARQLLGVDKHDQRFLDVARKEAAAVTASIKQAYRLTIAGLGLIGASTVLLLWVLP
jgi:hypothetical protein